MGPPPPPPQQTSNGTDGQLFSENMKDVFYDYDSYDVSAQYQQVLQADVRFLRQHQSMKFTIEGHCGCCLRREHCAATAILAGKVKPEF